ncbi:DUF2075 domain-containing protein [Olsenella sp. AM04-33]|uniref:DUF2075 domain-containing protein n=1 Tax=Olsenella sp. AM04-33 TaxID=2292049 RepID=UPI000E51DC65|nr:DUF2075 domain-containing protein [Olsenella sp. AM04-33]RHK02495.1 DUF2075 domain-containing protein [Olsenella sp. AM04-33]
MSVRQPVVIDVPFRADDIQIEQCIDQVQCEVDGSELTADERRLLKTYPTVYIIRGKERKRARGGYEYDDFVVYVGETNSIVRRTKEHYTDDVTYRSERGKKAWQRLNQPGSHILVIAQNHFNKSLTLDLENNFLSYLLASGASHVTLVNGRGNPQEDYYTKPELPIITSQAWRKLNRYEPELFPAESVIRDSAIFKASPFRALGKDQIAAEDAILGRLRDLMNGWAAAPQPPDSSAPVENGELIVVEGMAGTGKTVLLSHLFLRIMNEPVVPVAGDGSGDKITERPVNACLLINHEEQLTVYNAIMKRLGLQNKDGVVVDKPTRFINKHSESGHGNGLARQDYPCDPVDVALVDEAHLLLTQGNQGYSGSRNMLVDIMRRARVVIAVYDLGQVLRKSQELDASMRDALFPEKRFSDGKVRCARRAANVAGFPFHVENLLLRQQYRIDACDEVVRWIDDFANGRGVGPIPQDPAREGHTPYQIKVFDSPYDLKMAIEERAFAFDASSGEIVDDTSHGLSRVLATYDWPYSGQSKPESGVWEVRIYREQGGWVSYGASGARGGRGSRHAQAAASIAEVPRTQYFHMPWNYQTSATGDEAAREHDKAWAEQPHTLGECGSIYTIQGFDLNYAGVIIGPSVCWREGRLAFDPSKSCNSQAINGSEDPEANLRHELNVLLKRGVHGLYLFAVDGALEHRLLEMQEAGASE